MLGLLIFYETRQNPKKVFKVLSCVIYTKISNYICIDDLACKPRRRDELPVAIGEGFKHGKKLWKNWELEFQIC